MSEELASVVVSLFCTECGQPYRVQAWDPAKYGFPKPGKCPRCHNAPWLEGGRRGWDAIVRETHERLFALDPDYRIAQVKEKYGGLRFYFDSSPFVDGEVVRQMSAIEEEALARSEQTCQVCGAPGSPRSDGWVRTLCDACDAEGRT